MFSIEVPVLNAAFYTNNAAYRNGAIVQGELKYKITIVIMVSQK